MTDTANRPHKKTLGAPLRRKEPLVIEWHEYLWPTLFMLSLSLIGLQMPLGLLFAAMLLIRSFKENRYDFVIQLTIFFGGYSLMTDSDAHVNLSLSAFALSIVAILILRKPPILKKALIWLVLYAAGLIYFMLKSEETLLVQWLGFRAYMSIIYLFVPFLVFSGKEFDIRKFFRQLYIYVFIICTFYAIDSLIINGMFLLPRDPSWNTMKIFSTFYDPWFNPFSFEFPRRWPTGLYILILIIYPSARMYKLSKLQWTLIIASLLIARTFTFTIAIAIIYLFCSVSGKRVVIYIFGMVAALTILYYIDTQLPPTTYISGDGVEASTSALRIQSQIDQLTDLDPAKADEEALADFATGRGAQIIPKLELLFRMDREWIGFGFLSRATTTKKKYIIDNDLYGNPDEAVEVATGVESMPFQVLLDIGILGLIAHVLFFFGLWFVIRKLPYAAYYISVAVVFVIIGISGMDGLIRPISLHLVGLCYAAVIMNEKRQLGFDLPPLNEKSGPTAMQAAT